MADAIGSTQVHAERLVPFLGPHLVDRRALPDALVDHDHIESAEAIEGAGHEPSRGLVIGDVGLKRHGLAASAHNRGDRRARRGLVADVVHDDARPQAAEEHRDGVADAPRSAGDERRLAREAQGVGGWALRCRISSFSRSPTVTPSSSACFTARSASSSRPVSMYTTARSLWASPDFGSTARAAWNARSAWPSEPIWK